eukprot:434046_1
MHPRHEEAKQLFKTKQYKSAQQVLLDIISTNNGDNSKYLSKLGDIYCKFNDFNSAHSYYQQSLNENPQNPSVLIKLGNILSNHLHQTNQAISIYKQCLNIEPNSIECIFEYAKLMENENNYSKAKQLFIKCLQIDNTKASVHYHYAKLLTKYQQLNNYNDNNNDNNTSNINFLLKKACELQPQISKYHAEYAIFLQNNNQINKANDQWEIALEVCQYNDMLLLYQFGYFNLKYKNDNQNALKYYKMSAELYSNIIDENKKINYKYIADEYLQLSQSINEQKEEKEEKEEFKQDIKKK